MVEGGPDAGGDSSSARLTSSFVKVGDRTRFTVELRPGETTIVSWKKLMKDAAKAEGRASSSAAAAATAAAAAAAAPVPEPPANAHPALESRLSPGKPAANDPNDAPAPNRFSAVIEKIERLYMGKDSSDEEDLGDIPDDDQYDTEDSFIDDAELDEYFEVDKSKTKHDGYFVNRGQLEKVIEPSQSANQQPKKRRRKEMAKAPGDNDNGNRRNKHMRVGKKGAGRSAVSVDKNMLPKSQGPSLKGSDEMKIQSQTNASVTPHQKIAGDGKPSLDLSPSLRTSNGDVSSSLAESNDKQKGGIFPAKNSSSKLKEASVVSDVAQAKHHDRSEYMHKPHNVVDSEVVIQHKDKSGIREKLDLNLPDSKHTMQPAKTSLVHKKEGSSAKPKANLLEKAIRELEKMVAESRPPATDAQDADGSSQSIKRRLPREIKQKLAKVARLANASNVKVSQELLNRLMGILGHIIQVRTLKRHLKVLANMSLSAKQEKDDKFQQIKKEVVEMIKTRVPSLMSKAAEQQGGGSGDFQEAGHSDKALKGQLCMDATLEDKICDLYDIFVDGLDEDVTPQVRKLYAELAELWPKGVMDNHGIKRAICRAKERKRTLNESNKDHEKIKRKKLVATKIEETVRVESSSAAQMQYVDTRLATDPSFTAVSHQDRFFAGAIGNVAPSMSIPSTNVPNFERPNKQEKVKGTIQTHSLSNMRVVDGGVVKKKVKRKAENALGNNAHSRPDKLNAHQSDDRQKHHKHHGAAPPHQGGGAPNSKSSYEEFRFEPLT